MEKFSYSKLSTFEQCGFKYKLIYKDKHFIHEPSINTDFGTLLHYIEEQIAKDIVANDNEPVFLMDYDKYIDMFVNIDLHENGEEVIGVNKIKERYPDKFYEKDKNNLSYADKANIYIQKGVYRLRDYLSTNRNLRIKGIEQEFNLEYGDYIFHGFIDRVFENINTGEILIEDIKTYSAPLDQKELTTPLQFVFYVLAARKLYNTDKISCAYEINLCDCKQTAGTKGFVERSIKKIDKLLATINNDEFIPKPSPLCHWCVFSKTYPNQPEEAKNLCPYYSNWTRESKNFSCDYEWMGEANHQAILENFIKNNLKEIEKKDKTIIDVSLKPNCINNLNNSERRFIIRRI